MGLISPDSAARIQRELVKYPPEQKQSAVMSALAIVQDVHRHIQPIVVDHVERDIGIGFDLPALSWMTSAGSQQRQQQQTLANSLHWWPYLPSRLISARRRRDSRQDPAAR